MYFKDISPQIKDNRKNKQMRPVDWKEYDAFSMLRLNSEVKQYDGFTPRHRVFGRTPKMPTGAVSNPGFCDFANPKGSPFTQTHQVLAKPKEIQKSSVRRHFR